MQTFFFKDCFSEELLLVLYYPKVPHSLIKFSALNVENVEFISTTSFLKERKRIELK